MINQTITFAIQNNPRFENTTENLNVKLTNAYLDHLVTFKTTLLEGDKLYVTFTSKASDWTYRLGDLLKFLRSMYNGEGVYLHKVDTKRDRKIDLSEAQFNNVSTERLTYEQAYNFANNYTVEGKSLAFHRTSSVLAELSLYALVIDE